jgi:hypothetical protein
VKEKESIAWHPSFGAALQLELDAYGDELEYRLEYPLTSEPLKVDVIVRKKSDQPLDKHIARLFRKVNIVEYKSPKDYLSVNVFYKSLAYVYLYKCLVQSQEISETVDIHEITLSLVCMNPPSKLIQHLEKREKMVNRYQNGIYYIKGMDIPIQLIIQSELNERESEYLILLSDRLTNKKSLHQAFIRYIYDNKSELYRLFFHAIYEANPELFAEVLEMQKLEHDPQTQKKIDELVRKFEWDKKWKEEGLKAGREEGRKEEKLAVALKLLAKGMSLRDVSEVTGLSVEKLKQIKND